MRYVTRRTYYGQNNMYNKVHAHSRPNRTHTHCLTVLYCTLTQSPLELSRCPRLHMVYGVNKMSSGIFPGLSVSISKIKSSFAWWNETIFHVFAFSMSSKHSFTCSKHVCWWLVLYIWSIYEFHKFNNAVLWYIVHVIIDENGRTEISFLYLPNTLWPLYIEFMTYTENNE